MDRAVRRALVAGALTWVLSGGLLSLLVLKGAGGGDATAAALMLGLVAGSIISSAWLLTMTAADLLGRKPVPRARLWWIAGITVLAMASPALVAVLAVSTAD